MLGFASWNSNFETGRPVDYRFVEVNPAFERQTGLIQAEGQWTRTLAPQHEQHWFDIYGAVALTGEPIRFENPTHALQDRWFDVYAFRIGEPDRREVAILFSDITGRKQSEAALQQANRELQQTSKELQRSNDDLEQFARIAGHDLRAPLSSVIQFSELLVRRQKDTPDAGTQELVSDILESGKRMVRLIDDLLRYATISQTPLTVAAPV
jgi:signal transduction histidine kinase